MVQGHSCFKAIDSSYRFIHSLSSHGIDEVNQELDQQDEQ